MPHTHGCQISGTNKVGGLSIKQFGFRKLKSTIGAVVQVVQIFETAQQKANYSKTLMMLVVLGGTQDLGTIDYPCMRKMGQDVL